MRSCANTVHRAPNGAALIINLMRRLFSAGVCAIFYLLATGTEHPPILGSPQALAQNRASGSSSDLSSASWRLVRTPNPSGGSEAIAIIQTAQVLKSDIDFAGLMIRCGESEVEVLVTLLTPLSPRAHPRVTLSGGGESNSFVAAVAPPGALLLLPKEATALARGRWQSLPELSAQIDVGTSGGDRTDNSQALSGQDDPHQVNGIVDLGGLGPALARLQALCTIR
jgi:hypothetical protein